MTEFATYLTAQLLREQYDEVPISLQRSCPSPALVDPLVDLGLG